MKINIIFSFLLLMNVSIIIFLIYYSLKKEKTYVAIPLVPVAIYSGAYAIELICTNVSYVKIFINIQDAGIMFVGVFWLMMTLDFTGMSNNLKKRILAVLSIVPIITIILNYTNDYHHLFYTKIYINNSGIFPIVEISSGPAYIISAGYNYTLILAGVVILLREYTKAIPMIKRQILLLIIAWVLPWVSNIAYVFKILPFHIDICPFFLSISGMIYAFAVLKFKFLQIKSIATEKVFYSMHDGVIVFDEKDNLVNFNSSATSILPELAEASSCEIWSNNFIKKYNDLYKVFRNPEQRDRIIIMNNKGKQSYYKVNVNVIHEKDNEYIGKIMILHDVTENEVQKQKLEENLNFLETLMDAIPNPIYSKDKAGQYIHFNSAFKKFLGIEEEKILGNTANKIFREHLYKVYEESDRDLMETKLTQVYEAELPYNDGTNHDVMFNKSVLKDKEKNVTGIVGVIVDITEEKKNREKINKLLKLKEAMLKIGYGIKEVYNINDLLDLILEEVINCIDEKASGAILLLDEENNLKIAVSKGYNKEETKSFFVSLNEHRQMFNNGENIDKTVIFNNICMSQNVKMLKTEDGRDIKSAISSPIIIEGTLYGFVNIDSVSNNVFNESHIELMEYMRNQLSIAISKHKLYEQTIYLSRYDKLTNVFNRSYFEQFTYELGKKDDKFHVVIFDLNGLKFVNDNYGHMVGDELIREFAKEVKKTAVKNDIIARLGGDEFIGIFYEIKAEELMYKFEQLKKYFELKPIRACKIEVICSYSYGIASFGEDAIEYNELVKIADKRMYEYKRKIKRAGAL